MSENDLSCKHCKYWTESKGADAYVKFKESLGACHRYGPHSSRTGDRPVWPRTFSSDWCGEHKEKPPEPWVEMKSARFKCKNCGVLSVHTNETIKSIREAREEEGFRCYSCDETVEESVKLTSSLLKTSVEVCPDCAQDIVAYRGWKKADES